MDQFVFTTNQFKSFDTNPSILFTPYTIIRLMKPKNNTARLKIKSVSIFFFYFILRQSINLDNEVIIDINTTVLNRIYFYQFYSTIIKVRALWVNECLRTTQL